MSEKEKSLEISALETELKEVGAQFAKENIHTKSPEGSFSLPEQPKEQGTTEKKVDWDWRQFGKIKSFLITKVNLDFWIALKEKGIEQITRYSPMTGGHSIKVERLIKNAEFELKKFEDTLDDFDRQKIQAYIDLKENKEYQELLNANHAAHQANNLSEIYDTDNAIDNFLKNYYDSLGVPNPITYTDYRTYNFIQGKKREFYIGDASKKPIKIPGKREYLDDFDCIVADWRLEI